MGEPWKPASGQIVKTVSDTARDRHDKLLSSPNGYAPTDSGIHELDEPINPNHPEFPDS